MLSVGGWVEEDEVLSCARHVDDRSLHNIARYVRDGSESGEESRLVR